MRSLSLKSPGHVVAVLAAMCTGGACNKHAPMPAGTGGQAASGGSPTGGSAMGGAPSGGASGSGGVAGTGGSSADGGVSGGGGASIPSGTGGRNTGGANVANGGSNGTGGTGAGGSGTRAGGAPGTDFTETVGGVSFEMVYVPGGTFTLGCEAATCPPDTTPVSGVNVSSYFIGKTEVTTALWNAVTGDGWDGAGSPVTRITWFDALAFACKLSQKTGRNYRMMTEAEFEYAAKNHLKSLDNVGSGEEWAYNSWSNTHMGGTDPVGPSPGKHMQKTRRDVQGSVDSITGRLIRSVDGFGPALRLTLSAEMDFPPSYGPPCALSVGIPLPVNSYRDPQWITGSDARWASGSVAVGQLDLRVWDDGTARLNDKDGQWFTSNNVVFVFVPSSGPLMKFPYIFLGDTQASLISETSYMRGGFIGRIEKTSAPNFAKPALSGLKSGADLAAAAGDDYRMVDMVDIPESAKNQDARLLDGTGQCWFQDNTSAGGLHHFRQDIDADEYRLTLNQGQMTMLANGKWFTVNNTFLRIVHSTGYTTDYLYALTPEGDLFHLSFQGYETGDFKMFHKKANTSTFPVSCGSQCSSEIPKGEPASTYAKTENGQSTFRPAPCPTGGCK